MAKYTIAIIDEEEDQRNQFEFVFEKIFNVFYYYHYKNRNEPLLCEIHKFFKKGHNCVGCNLNNQNHLIVA